MTRQKTGGRQKGTVNKPRAELAALLESKWPGYNAVVRLAEIAEAPDTDIDTRVKCLQAVARHTVPTLKATEHTIGGAGGNTPVSIKIEFVGAGD